MTRMTLLALAATLAAGTAGATTIISTHGTNTLRINQSPVGTVIHDGIGVHYFAPMTEEPLVLRRTERHQNETHNPSGFARFFWFLNGFDGFHRAPAADRSIVDCITVPTRSRAMPMFDGEPGENQAADMMRTILRRMDR